MKEIKLYYFTGRPNFGDLLNEYICEKLFNCKVIKAPVNECEACFIGSILNPFFNRNLSCENLEPLNIWGSGLIDKIPMKKKFIRRANIYALRGKVTKMYLEAHKVQVSDNVVLGDPGLLCSKVFTDKIEKEYDWGIIPHYVDRNNINLKKLNLPNSIKLDICERPEILIPKILKCKKIIASAMHGLIVADSFGIPNIRMILDDKMIGGDFKFNDYYSAFNIVNHTKLDLRKVDHVLTDIPFEYLITKDQVEKIQNDLIGSFPYA